MGAGNSSGKANASNMMTKLLKHQVESLDPTTATTKFDSLYKPNGAVISWYVEWDKSYAVKERHS